MNFNMQPEMKMTLPVCATIEAIETVREWNNEEEQKEENVQRDNAIGKEQFMKLKISAKNLEQDVEVDKTHLIIAADFSGSMGGNPEKQVKNAIKDILSSTLCSPHIATDVIVYNSDAKVLEFSESNYEEVVDKLKAGSMTNFVQVFMKLSELFKNEDDSTARIIVVFLTDGSDTCNSDIKGQTATWIESLKDIQREIAIHSVGFSTRHNFEFMKILANAGKTPGMYRYCEPGDGQTVLQEKLQELFDFIVIGSNKVNVTVSIDGDNKFIHNGHMKQTCKLDGAVTRVGDNEDCSEIVVESWIYLPDPITVPNITVEVTKEVKNKELITFPCEVIKVEKTVLESAYDKKLWNLRIVSRNADILAVSVSDVIINKGDATKVKDRLNKLHERIKDTEIFGKGIDKELREDMIKFLKEITSKVDMMHSMLASYVRGETQSVAMLARAHDMRFQCKFSKSRRQRLMDKRATKNISYAKSAQDQLSMLQVNLQEVENINHDATGFYFCALSQNSIKDILLGSDEDDAIGFGLAVKRPEHALDEPTAIRLWNISGTLVSRNAMLDALEYKIKIDGHLSAHGGFDFKDSPLGVTTIGLGREPINAWLPLYVTQSHWNRIKVLLKPTLGYFCTLDPLGYDYKQIDIMFMVLGSMIGQLSEQSVGEHQLKLIFAFHRTCFACVKDFDLTSQIFDMIQNFIKSPAGRTKDVVPNLSVLIGYIISLPANRIQALFKKDEDSADRMSTTLRKFWLAYLAEIIRRAAGSLYRESATNVINGLIDMILHGKAEEIGEECVIDKADEKLIHQCQSSEVTDSTLNFDIPTFDPIAHISMPAEGEISQDPKLDKTMEIWARAEFHRLKSKHQAMAVRKAKTDVKNWFKNLKESIFNNSNHQDNNQDCSLQERVDDQSVIGTENTEEENKQNEDFYPEKAKDDDIQSESHVEKSADQNDQSQQPMTTYDTRRITKSVLDLMTMLNRKLGKAASPYLRSIPGCIAFINFRLNQNEDFQAMDGNSGLPPEEWITAVKEVVTSTYSQISACTDCSKQDINDSDDALVVMATDEELQINNTIATSPMTVVPEAATNDLVCDNSQEVADDAEITTCKGNHGDSNQGNQNTDGDDHDNDNDLFEDYEDEIDYTDTASRINSRKRQERQRVVSIPVLIHIINSDLDIIQMMRAMLCQAVRYHSNSQARSAIQGKHFTDLSDTDTISCDDELKELHDYLQTFRENAVKNVIDSFIWKKSNQYMLQTPSIWSFLGYLMNTYSERHEGFSDLVSAICHIDNGETVPELEEKVRILFCGKYEDKPVIAKGNVWLPDNKVSKKLSGILGEEVWIKIEVDLRSNLQLHVYRASDIPNRHGHCNSNPYIPNVLRSKLGMPLLKVKNRRTRSRRLKSSFT